MNEREIELMMLLVKIHKKINQLHEESVEPSDEFMVKYVASKLSFEITEDEQKQILEHMGK